MKLEYIEGGEAIREAPVSIIISHLVESEHNLVSLPLIRTFESLRVHHDYLITLWYCIGPEKKFLSYPPRYINETCLSLER